MKEFIKSNQCLLYHVIIWSILIFVAMIEHRDYTFLIIMAFFSLLNIYKTSRVNWYERLFEKQYNIPSWLYYMQINKKDFYGFKRKNRQYIWSKR